VYFFRRIATCSAQERVCLAGCEVNYKIGDEEQVMGDLGADAAMTLTSEMLWTAVLLAAPIIGVATLVGLAVSILQVVTQIQESSLSFVPKLAAAVAVLLVLGSWMMATLMRYASGVISSIPHLL
jgi:flagellar biosynthetic protein FliQ